MSKVRCLNPKHTDDTPSMEVYEDGAYCFSCGFSTNERSENFERKPKENIQEALEYIDGLTVRQIRGIPLPSDEQGFYILWPNRDYYKKRLFEGKSRYLGPSGHRPPPFIIPGKNPDTAVVVEGELNALSLHTAIGDLYTIVSPGAASNFTNNTSIYVRYTTVYVIVDKDVAGVIAGLKLKEELLKLKKRVQLVAKEKDYNQTLQDSGVEGLRLEVLRDLGLS